MNLLRIRALLPALGADVHWPLAPRDPDRVGTRRGAGRPGRPILGYAVRDARRRRENRVRYQLIRRFARGTPFELERFRSFCEERDAQHILQWGGKQVRASGAVTLALRDGDDPTAVHIEGRAGRAGKTKIGPSSALRRGE